ncbi:hypothetical protein FLONG3_367 [Fusarium longipes]|uniref:Uncharacterized protein n=1 Tax=Fusarium longipes TaxID=694270 RepID=A0A395T9Y7_9HYPO|nr:hypothetical protein FLONG3_367 [Fusarium longipes]
MANPDQEARNGDEIVRKINAGLGPRDIDFSVDACPSIPIEKISLDAIDRLCQNIVAEIFHETGVKRNQARQTWNDMAERIMLRMMLQIRTLPQHFKWSAIPQRIDVIRSIHKATNKPVSMPAPDLAFIIAAIVFRKMQVEHPNVKKLFIEFFGDFNGMRWLPVAIKVHKQINGRPLVIELDQKATEPRVRLTKIDARKVAIVTVREPPKNIYETAMQEVVRQMTNEENRVIPGDAPDAKNQPRKSTEKADPDSEYCHDKTLKSQPDQPPNSETLRDHARQMKQFGKRLASPDQAFIRRVRRDMCQFANLTDEKEKEASLERDEMLSKLSSTNHPDTHTGTTKIDLFGRYKMLWKGSLRENGCIPDSLRQLVHHDCDANQIFYLEETETDFRAANTIPQDGDEI